MLIGSIAGKQNMGRRDGNETLLMCMCERDKGERGGREREG